MLALVPPAFMHRFSSEDNPEAPLSHHWLDSTHISYGVVTAGYEWDRVKLETSAFNGREPDQKRYDVELRGLDSYSARLSYNPLLDLALQVSFGRLASPEQLEPKTSVRRSPARPVTPGCSSRQYVSKARTLFLAASSAWARMSCSRPDNPYTARRTRAALENWEQRYARGL
jgi:hypothetical protein